MASRNPGATRLTELLLQSLETEAGAIEVYRTALSCVRNEHLKEAWQEYLDETENHHRILLSLLEALDIDADTPSPGREVVARIGQALVQAMELARASGPPEAAELVACECIVLAETKDHTNWALIGHAAERLSGPTATVLKAAHAAVRADADHHLFLTAGWCRELWIQSLGFPAVLPPPEEVQQVETAIGAARAELARAGMLKRMS